MSTLEPNPVLVGEKSSEHPASSQYGRGSEFCQMVRGLELNGYFERAFDKDCVDAPAEVHPAHVLEEMLAIRMPWPLVPARLADEPDTLFDVMEALHDLVSRPRSRSMHNYSGCGWHHSDFSLAAGRGIYICRLNRILGRNDLGLSLEAEGVLAGRLMNVTDDARTELVKNMNERADPATGDRVRVVAPPDSQ